jgi:hypothetical protein
MSLKRIAIPSPNYSSRGGSVRLVILHTAEGALSIESLGSYFANPSSQVSSNVGIDDKANTVGEYVPANNSVKSWTQGNANPVCVSAELCAFAGWSRAEWDAHPAMLDNAAKWIAEECARFGVPCRYVGASDAQNGGTGVTDHAALGSWGGGHWDCGSSFPMAEVIAVAAGQAPSVPAGPSSPAAGGGAAPPFPGTLLIDFTAGHGSAQWQGQMAARGWSLAVDDLYGSESARVCTQFQSEKGLAVDGIVGPDTWAAAWTAPIT